MTTRGVLPAPPPGHLREKKKFEKNLDKKNCTQKKNCTKKKKNWTKEKKIKKKKFRTKKNFGPPPPPTGSDSGKKNLEWQGPPHPDRWDIWWQNSELHVPPPPCEQTEKAKTLPSLKLRLRAVIIHLVFIVVPIVIVINPESTDQLLLLCMSLLDIST